MVENAAGILGIIPARGGSKSVPNKNIAAVAGRPLIAYTIRAALEARCIDRLIVSTDSEEIAEVACSLGAEVPFLRPPELARDSTAGIAPILHAIRWLDRNESYRPGLVACLQPTSPLRTARDIDAAVGLALDRNAEAVVSVAPVCSHPYWMKQIDAAGRLLDAAALPRPFKQRQELPRLYALNGAIYLARRDVLLDHETWYTERTFAYIMPPERSLDIDTPWELYLASLVVEAKSR
jgi:N-acylneuraminate cytidylyltransferase/CMP-N,N'-diacetyllegionaminic acid synthase